MNDLISRQAAIDAICKEGTRLERNGTVAMCEIKQWCIDLLERLPSAQPEQRWIPCSERLPEENGRYLVTRGLKACDSLWNRVYIANYSDFYSDLMGLKKEKIWWSDNVGKSDFEKFDDVIAWMPLPESYREERTEE